MTKCHECTLVINQSYRFEILETIIKSFEGWGEVIIFLVLALTLLVLVLVLAVFIRVCNEGASMAFCHGVYILAGALFTVMTSCCVIRSRDL